MHGDYDGMAPQSIWYKALKWVVGTVCAVVGVSFKVYRPLEYMGVKAAGTLGVCHTLKAAGYKLSAMMFKHAMYGYGGKISAEMTSMLLSKIKGNSSFVEAVRKLMRQKKPNGSYALGADEDGNIIDTDLYLAVHRADFKIKYNRRRNAAYIIIGDVFDFSELWFASGEKATTRNKILNDIGFCLENARFMYKFSWQVGFYIPY